MNDTLLIKDVQPHIRRWTTLVQVVERSHILVSQKDTSISYRRFLLVDMEGNKVSVVAYNSNIRATAPLLIPFKRYYVSGAAVKKTDEKYRVGEYEYSWTITKHTLIQPYDETTPPPLSCHINLQEFANLYKFADTESLQNVMGVVIHAFAAKQLGFDSISRDIVVVNDEKMPVMLTLWNEYATVEGQQLASSLGAGNVILAMRVRVTTFNGISLSTRAASALLINPPMVEATALKQWFVQNKSEITELVVAEAYKDLTILLPPPIFDKIMPIEKLLDPSNNIRTGWIKGTITLGRVDQPLWFTVCMNCQKKFELQVSSAIKCTSCDQHSTIGARARIPVLVEDNTAFIPAILYGSDAEDITTYTGEQLQMAEAKGDELLSQIGSAMNGKDVVCFVRMFQALTTQYTIIKLYMATEVPSLDAPTETTNPETEASQTGQEEIETVLFTPVGGENMELTDTPGSKPKASGLENMSAKRQLKFGGDKITTESGSSSAIENAVMDEDEGNISGQALEGRSSLKKARSFD